MELALNGATTMKADLETDIRAAGDAGFDRLEIWASKLRAFLEIHSPADLNKAGHPAAPTDRRGIAAHWLRSVVSVEIFRPEYWEWNPFDLAREARAAVERAMGV